MFDRLTQFKSPSAKGLRLCWPWIMLGLVILLVVGVRFRLREMPLERDEGEYAYAGQLILQGIPPYKLVYNMKLPGTYAAYAVIMAAFGQTASGIHAGLILVNVAAIVLVFLLGRKLLDEIAGAVAAVAYALMTLSPSVLGLQAHATHFVVLPALAGALVLLHVANTRRLGWLFVSGGLLGLAFVMKQHGALFGVFGFSYLVWITTRVESDPRSRRAYSNTAPESPGTNLPLRHEMEERAGERRSAVSQAGVFLTQKSQPTSAPASKNPGAVRSRRVHRSGPPPRFRFDWDNCVKPWGVFGAGLAVPYALTCAILWPAGVFPQFFFWTVSYANKYITAVPLANASEQIHEAFAIVTSPNLWFWLLAVLGAVVMWWEKRLARRRVFVVAFFICSVLSISIGFYFRPHYFILLLPALSLLAGIAVSRGIYVIRQERTLELLPAVVSLLLFVVGLGSEALTQSAFWFEFSPVKACQQIYGSSLFPEAVRIAGYVSSNTPPQATIAVIGSEPEIYFYSRRHSATGFIYMYPLMESHEYALKMQTDMIREIETSKPEYAVFVQMRESWLAKSFSHQRLLDWWTGYRAEHYDMVRMVDIKAEKFEDEESGLEKSGNMFSDHRERDAIVPQAGPTNSGSVFIFKRKSGLKLKPGT